MPLFNVAIPPNAQGLFNYMHTIMSFDIIDLQPAFNKILNLEETGALNSNFEEIGITSLFFLNNMGSLFMAFSMYSLSVLTLRVVNKYAGKKRFLE